MKLSPTIRAGIFMGVFFLLGVSNSLPSFGQGMAFDTDFYGSDFRDFDLPEARPELCQAECARDSRCMAWTYAKPGARGPSAHCRLKDSVPNPTQDSCCVSGVNTTQPPQQIFLII